MADTVSDVNVLVRSLLNDVGAEILTDAFLLPLIKKAYREIEKDLALNGIGTTEEISAILSVAAGATPKITLTELPDMIIPLEVNEGDVGATDSFTKIEPTEWEEDVPARSTIWSWVWRENEIKFPPLSSARTVKVKYRKSLTILTGNSSTIGIIGALDPIASKVAALAQISLGGREDYASALASDSKDEKDKIIAIEVKAAQKRPVKRIPFRRRV